MDQDVRTGAAPEVRTLRKSTLTVDGPVACLEMTDVASRNAISQRSRLWCVATQPRVSAC